jgi:hypothetical protein
MLCLRVGLERPWHGPAGRASAAAFALARRAVRSRQHACDAWWCARALSCVLSTQEAALEISRTLQQVRARGVLACTVRICAVARL